MNNFMNGFDKEKLDTAIKLIKNSIGEKESAKLEQAAASESELSKMLDGIGEKERAAILKVMNDPQLLTAVLSSPKAREGIKKFLNER